MRTTLLLALAALVACTLARPASAKDDDFPERAPFTAAHVQGGVFSMQVDGTWYRLRTIDGIAAADLVAHAKKTYGKRMEKRLVEDLVEVMASMGAMPADTVALVLERVDDGGVVTLPSVPMTESNRRKAWRARQFASRGFVRAVVRSRVRVYPTKYAFLAKATEGRAGGPTLDRRDALQDLDQLEWLIRHKHAYATLRGEDIAAAFDTVRSGITEDIARNTFAIQLMKLISLFGDGHARVAENPGRILAPGYAPYLLGDCAGRVVAFAADRSALLDAKHPYVIAIDGVDIKQWLDAASQVVARGSPQLVQERSLRVLRHINHVRRALNLPELPKISVTLASVNDSNTATVIAPVVDRKPIYGTWPRGTPTVPDGIAYVRIESMGDSTEVVQRLDKLAPNTRGLILDVRGNGGGSRDILRAVLPRFLPPGAAAVVNVAKARRPKDAADGHALADRYLHPISAPHWSERDRSAIETFRATFQPEWTVPTRGFSDWHYMVLRNEDTRRIKLPTVVLIDDVSFSATDVFAGAMAGRENVTLLGLATAGGSGRARSHVLANSRIRVRLSSMASFRPNGKLYDTQGVSPDVEVPRKPTDWIGTTDTALEAAIRRLQ